MVSVKLYKPKNFRMNGVLILVIQLKAKQTLDQNGVVLIKNFKQQKQIYTHQN